MNYNISNKWNTQTITENVRRLITDMERCVRYMANKRVITHKLYYNPILFKINGILCKSEGIYPKL